MIYVPPSLPLPVIIYGRATIDPPESYKRPVTLQEQPQEILTKILKDLDHADQTCLALTCKDLLVKIRWTTEFEDTVVASEVKHKMGKDKHIKLYDKGSNHGHSDLWYSVLSCPLGECFWKNWRIKQWAFKVEYQARERHRLGIEQNDEFWSFYRLKQWGIDVEEIDNETVKKGGEKRKFLALVEAEASLEPIESAPVGTASVYARMAMRYAEGRYELKATAPTVADYETENGRAKPKKLSWAEKKARRTSCPSYSMECYGSGGERRFMLHTA
ncbi:hypothetical protein LTR84_011486 [Exophiala bonariae]|uniref:F-box domain-containing protein n=1 Tax=Exophiala bonariae TaxID=1690606 RepID=A0AAV9NIK1_9EURO|nr:hypothetical protein LTR84_011486 [Exophiala bonariae]